MDCRQYLSLNGFFHRLQSDEEVDFVDVLLNFALCQELVVGVRDVALVQVSAPAGLDLLELLARENDVVFDGGFGVNVDQQGARIPQGLQSVLKRRETECYKRENKTYERSSSS